VIPSSRFGQRPSQPVEYTRVVPSLVVELDVDTAFEQLVNGRRPVLEATVATAAREEPGVTVRRGVRAAGLLAGPSALPGVVHAHPELRHIRTRIRTPGQNGRGSAGSGR
jgi:hypothetical protein